MKTKAIIPHLHLYVNNNNRWVSKIKKKLFKKECNIIFFNNYFIKYSRKYFFNEKN